MPLYEKGDVRIHYEEVGTGFPLLVIPGGGLNSTVAGLATHPFNPFDEFQDEFRVIAADLRNAKGGQSTGPLEVDRPWDAYTDDHIGLMDHLGIGELVVFQICTFTVPYAILMPSSEGGGYGTHSRALSSLPQ